MDDKSVVELLVQAKVVEKTLGGFDLGLDAIRIAQQFLGESHKLTEVILVIRILGIIEKNHLILDLLALEDFAGCLRSSPTSTPSEPTTLSE